MGKATEGKKEEEERDGKKSETPRIYWNDATFIAEFAVRPSLQMQ